MIFKTIKHIIQTLQNRIQPTAKLSAAHCLLQSAICLLFLTFNYTVATAQSFPVQVIPQVTPPPPIYFREYANENTVNSPLRVQLILNDFEIANREVRLRVSFEGSGISFQSKDLVTGASPLFLEGGVPLVLTNVELAPYFRYENLNGISGNVYGNAIPEGAYNFCFEVFDVLTGSRLSQKSCAISVVFQNEPPFLVSPRNKTNVEEINPQNIVFQWTPRHVNVSNVEYELSIVEIWDTQVDPQQAFLSSPPVFQTVTNATTYVYGPADPLLLSGKNYAWRVQAKAKQGLEEVGLFENQGYSEIYSFSYAGSCDLPLGINHEVKGSTNANVFWDDFSTDVPEYTLRYRQKNVEGAEWFTNKTSGNQTTLWDLKPGTVYEYQVQKQCTVTGSDWSVTKQFTTFIADEEAAVYDCNITPNFNLSNKEPLPNLYAGDAFKAGDFPIKVLETSGSNGRFTGKGYVTIPYLNSIRVGVAFTNVLVNTDNQLVEGSVVTVYDPSMRNILDIDEAIDTVTDAVDAVGEFVEGDNDLDEIKVNWAIDKDDIKIEDGKVVITNPQNGVTKSEPLGDDMVITDSEGKTYYVDAEGEITEGGTIDQNGAITSNNVEGVSNNGQLESLTAQGIQVTFNEEGTYGMDIMPTGNIGKLAQEYTVIKDADGKDYPLTHHSVKKGATTKIKATIDLKNGDYKADDVSFKTKQGDSIPTTFNGSTATLTLTGRYSFENEVIYATVPSKEDNSKQLTAGAFTLWHLTERSVNVALVSVNGASLGSIESNVSKIFEKAVANIQFGKSLSLSVKKSELGSNQTLDFGESAWAAAYNEEQKMLVNRVKQLEGYNASTYYILVFNDIEPSRPIGGFMPLQRQMGFVFGGKPEEEDKGGDKSKTLAHEIGHGIFALQHPFSKFGTDEQQTDWLMDYGSGDQLPHTHWAQIHNPDLRFYTFQDEEDGEYTNQDYYLRMLQQIRCAFASNVDYIEMPSKYQNGLNESEIIFHYGINNEEQLINGDKITRAWITTASGRENITGILSYQIDSSKGEIRLGNLLIKVPVYSYNINNGITPFEHFVGFLFPDESVIETEFNYVWNNGIRQKIESGSSLSYSDVDNLKKIASCGSNLLNIDTKLLLIKSLLNVGIHTDEEEEDLILDLIANTPEGLMSKQLYEGIISDFQLLEDLMASLDNKGIRGNENNFSRLGEEIFRLFDKSHNQNELNNIYNDLNDSYKLYFHGFKYKFCQWDITSSRNGNRFQFEETEVFNLKYNYNPIQNPTGVSCDYEEFEYTFSYNDVIAVHFIGDSSEVTFSDGIHIMPAAVYYILIRAHDNEILLNSVKATWFALGLLTPVDEFYLLGKAFQYGKNAFQVIRLTKAKSLARNSKINLPIGEASDLLKTNSGNKLDDYVEFSLVNAGGNSIASFNKLSNGVASSLDNSIFSSLSSKLDNQGFIRYDNNQFLFQSPKTFLNEKSNSLYDFTLDGQFYIKYDLSDGRILFTNVQDGTYYAYVQNKTPLIIQSGQNVDEVIKTHLIAQTEKLKILVGLTNNRSVNVLGQVINPSTTKTTTFIGRMDDINGLKSQLGDFKNVDLGENIGGINILNRPDAIWNSAGYDGWIINHNMPWIKRVVNRSDEVYLATNPNDLNKLMWTKFNGADVPTISAYELRELVIGNLKPVNVSSQKWSEIQTIVQQMESNNLFINY